MIPGLDVRSIALACGVTHLAVALALTYVRLHQRTYPGFGAWALSAWSSFAGITLVALRGILPDLLTVILGNLCLIGTASLVQIGISSFTGRRPALRLHIAFLAAATTIQAYFTYLHPSLEARLVVISLAVAILALNAARFAWRHLGDVLDRPNPLVPSTILFVGVIYVLRAPLTMLMPPSTQDYLAPSLGQGLALLVYLLGHTTLSGGLLVLNSQRVEQELRAAMEECKVLRGIIPICAHCKKVRDDRGAWDAVESYIRRHTEAEFSHGICPECARTLFGKHD